VTDEVLDFLRNWTVKHDADLLVLRNEAAVGFRAVREDIMILQIRTGVIEQRLSAIETRLASYETTSFRRLERIEKRLELTD
jgi:hypothetical protein